MTERDPNDGYYILSCTHEGHNISSYWSGTDIAKACELGKFKQINPSKERNQSKMSKTEKTDYWNPDTLQHFRFCTNVGEIYAAVRADTSLTEGTMRVGFAACNPKDRSLPRKLKRDRGRGLAKRRWWHSAVHVPLKDITQKQSEMTGRDKRKLVQEALFKFLTTLPEDEIPAEHLGFNLYHHPEGGEFNVWYERFAEKLWEEGVRR